MRRWKKKSATWTVMFGLLAVGLTVYVAYGADANSMDRSGQGSSGMSDQGSSGMTGQGGGQAMPGHEMTGQGGAQYTPNLINANKLIGKDIKNNQGQKIGSVTDVVLGPGRERVMFVVLSTGGTMGAAPRTWRCRGEHLIFRPAETPSRSTPPRNRSRALRSSTKAIGRPRAIRCGGSR